MYEPCRSRKNDKWKKQKVVQRAQNGTQKRIWNGTQDTQEKKTSDQPYQTTAEGRTTSRVPQFDQGRYRDPEAPRQQGALWSCQTSQDQTHIRTAAALFDWEALKGLLSKEPQLTFRCEPTVSSRDFPCSSVEGPGLPDLDFNLLQMRVWPAVGVLIDQYVAVKREEGINTVVSRGPWRQHELTMPAQVLHSSEVLVLAHHCVYWVILRTLLLTEANIVHFTPHYNNLYLITSEASRTDAWQKSQAEMQQIIIKSKFMTQKNLDSSFSFRHMWRNRVYQ